MGFPEVSKIIGGLAAHSLRLQASAFSIRSLNHDFSSLEFRSSDDSRREVMVSFIVSPPIHCTLISVRRYAVISDAELPSGEFISVTSVAPEKAE